MSLIAAIARTAAERPQKVALITEKSQMSLMDLLQLAQVMDVELVTRGLRAGQTVVTWDPAEVEAAGFAPICPVCRTIRRARPISGSSTPNWRRVRS